MYILVQVYCHCLGIAYDTEQISNVFPSILSKKKRQVYRNILPPASELSPVEVDSKPYCLSGHF